MRLVIIVRNQALRISSAVVRAGDFCDRIAVINLGDDDETRVLAEQCGADVIPHHGETDAPTIAGLLTDSIIGEERTVIIALDSGWSLSDMARTVGLSRQGHDVFLAFKHRTQNRRVESSRLDTPLSSDTYSYSEADIQFACASKVGLAAIAKQSCDDVPSSLGAEIELRVVELDPPEGPPARESLASASRFAQYFCLAYQVSFSLF
jgi:hypothetical protein